MFRDNDEETGWKMFKTKEMLCLVPRVMHKKAEKVECEYMVQEPVCFLTPVESKVQSVGCLPWPVLSRRK